MIINQIAEELKNESIMHRNMSREAPQRFYQQSEFSRSVNNKDEEESKVVDQINETDSEK